MSAEPAVLARNTSYFTLALITQKVISFLYFTFLARTLGPDVIGKYVLALALTTIFSVLLDLGLSSVLTREVARQRDQAEKLTQLIFGFKLIAMAIVVAGVVFAVHLLGYPLLTRQLVYVACGVMVLDSFILTTYSAIRGFHTLTWESFGTILVQLTIAGVGLTFAQLTHDVRWFMGALLTGVCVHATYALWQLPNRFSINLVPRLSWPDFQQLARLAWPFALAAILIRIYGYLDTVLLSKLASDHAVGIYSVAYKVTFSLQFIPSAFSASLFPGFSLYFTESPQKLADTFTRGLVYLTAIAVPLSLGAIVIAPVAISTLYPAFTEAILPLQVLMSSLPFLFATFPVGSLLPACNRQQRNTANIAVATGLSIVLNLALIPHYGPLGAAVGSLLSTVTLLVLGWVVVRKLVRYDSRFLWGRLGRIVAAGVGMSLAAWWLVQYMHAAAATLIAGVVYLVLLVIWGGVTKRELWSLAQLIFKSKPGTTAV